MASEYFYVLFKAGAQTETWQHKTKTACGHSLEELIPCPVSGSREILTSIQKNLISWGYQLEDQSSWDSIRMAMALDFDTRRLILTGLGQCWNLPATTIARFAIPLLKHFGWHDWQITHSIYGMQDFNDVEFRLTQPKFTTLPQAFSKAPSEYLATKNPWSPFEFSENLLITIRRGNEIRHCLSPYEGHFHMGLVLKLGSQHAELLDTAPRCELLPEVEVCTTLFIDYNEQRIVQGIEDLNCFGSSGPYNPDHLQALWPGWNFAVNEKGYLGHLEQTGLDSENQHLILTPETLAQHIVGYYQAAHRSDELDSAQQSLPGKSIQDLTLSDWFEGLLLHPKTGPHLIRLLEHLTKTQPYENHSESALANDLVNGGQFGNP